MIQKYYKSDGTETNPNDMTDLEMAKAGLTQRSRDYANYNKLTGKRSAPKDPPGAGGAQAAPTAMPEEGADRAGSQIKTQFEKSTGEKYDGFGPGGSAQLNSGSGAGSPGPALPSATPGPLPGPPPMPYKP